MFNGDVTQTADQLTSRGSASKRWRIVAIEHRDGIPQPRRTWYADDEPAAERFAAAQRLALRDAHVYIQPLAPTFGAVS